LIEVEKTGNRRHRRTSRQQKRLLFFVSIHTPSNMRASDDVPASSFSFPALFQILLAQACKVRRAVITVSCNLHEKTGRLKLENILSLNNLNIMRARQINELPSSHQFQVTRQKWLKFENDHFPGKIW
jgi:hypothetical protein